MNNSFEGTHLQGLFDRIKIPSWKHIRWQITENAFSDGAHILKKAPSVFPLCWIIGLKSR